MILSGELMMKLSFKVLCVGKLPTYVQYEQQDYGRKIQTLWYSFEGLCQEVYSWLYTRGDSSYLDSMIVYLAHILGITFLFCYKCMWSATLLHLLGTLLSPKHYIVLVVQSFPSISIPFTCASASVILSFISLPEEDWTWPDSPAIPKPWVCGIELELYSHFSCSLALGAKSLALEVVTSRIWTLSLIYERTSLACISSGYN